MERVRLSGSRWLPVVLALAGCPDPGGGADDGSMQPRVDMAMDGGPQGMPDLSGERARWSSFSIPAAVRPTNAMMLQVRGYGRNILYIGCQKNVLLFSAGKGNEWQRLTSGLPADGGDFTGIHIRSENEVYVAYHHHPDLTKNGRILRSTNNKDFAEDYTGDLMTSVWGHEDQLYAAGGTKLGGVSIRKRMGAGRWMPDMNFAGVLKLFWDIAGDGPQHLYAVGENPIKGIIHYSTGNGIWTDQAPGAAKDLYSVIVIDRSNIYVVGALGEILYSPGDGTWTRQQSGTAANLWSGWGANASDIYVVGEDGIYHSKGDGVWNKVDLGDLGAGKGFNSIWGSDPNNIWVATTTNEVLHYGIPPSR